MHNMILLFQNSQDDMNVDTLPALLTLQKEHVKAILAETTIRHPHPKASTVFIALNDECFPSKPSLIPLEKGLAITKRFSTPDHITAIVNIHEKTFEIKLTYGYSDQGIWSSETFFGDAIGVQHLSDALTVGEDMTEWLTNDCNDIAYVKEVLGEALFTDMLSEMDVEESDLQETQGGI